MDGAEIGGLREIQSRAEANGVPDVRWIWAEEIRDHEPHARGLAALHSPHTAITAFVAIAGRSPPTCGQLAARCGGPQSRRLARMAGDEDDPAIIPFRGEYLDLVPHRSIWSKD